MVLFELSRRLFGEEPSWRAVWREIPRAWTRRFFYRFLWARFSPWMPVTLAVEDLEGLRGKDYGSAAARWSAAARAWSCGFISIADTAAAWIGLGILALVMMFMPEGQDAAWQQAMESWDPDFPMEIPLLITRTVVACVMLAMSLTDVFVIGAGFGVYINNRTWIEGWDVELAFKRLAQRLGKSGGGGAFVFHDQPVRPWRRKRGIPPKVIQRGEGGRGVQSPHGDRQGSEIKEVVIELRAAPRCDGNPDAGFSRFARSCCWWASSAWIDVEEPARLQTPRIAESRLDKRRPDRAGGDGHGGFAGHAARRCPGRGLGAVAAGPPSGGAGTALSRIDFPGDGTGRAWKSRNRTPRATACGGSMRRARRCIRIISAASPGCGSGWPTRESARRMRKCRRFVRAMAVRGKEGARENGSGLLLAALCSNGV